ncbi:MAG TPA: UDP-N-acetylmuramoyl-L-alanine--D-glutamate ligase [Actinomycetota bacterium]|nr:UDP-N-acetylmuramoyl-L-alanine--D-glutamate ligase [Actinomycetota bacterium]
MSGAFAGERFVVVGLGVAGRAAARVLAEEGAAVRVTEQRSAVDVADELDAMGVDVRLGGHDPSHLDDVDAVVASPGVPEHAAVLRWAVERGTPIWSELDIGARLCRVPYVAITGTNGKSTATKLVAAMMSAAGLDAVACGNIGHPFSVAAREGHDALAVETSSFQLRFHHWLHPRVSVLLNVAPDHLDWHGSLDGYGAAKARIFELQGPGDTHVGNLDDAAAGSISRAAPCEIVWFGTDQPALDGSSGHRPTRVGVRDGEIVARWRAEEFVLGRPAHDAAGFVADCAAAGAAGLSFGLSPDAVGSAIRTTRPLPHRGEEVARIGAVRFLDDSKATNVHAALHALRGKDDVVLIAGGMAKGVDLSPLARAIPSLAGVVALGEAAPEIVSLFEGRVPVRTADSIEEAVSVAHAMAPPEGIVLLAPACASWDMFRDYTERGDRFAAAARALAGDGTRVES